MICPLCSSPSFQLFDQDKNRHYFRCESCRLVYVPRDELISLDEEEKRYESHENFENDPGYISYLKGTRDQILPFLKLRAQGLDFGCGKTELLSQLFLQNDCSVDSYDVFFHPKENIWQKKYDFIILSEVIEHLREPLETMKALSQILHPSGQIFIKTKFYPESSEKFKNWFYKRDKTHVQFFNDQSMGHLSNILKAKNTESLGQDLIRLQFP